MSLEKHLKDFVSPSKNAFKKLSNVLVATVQLKLPLKLNLFIVVIYCTNVQYLLEWIASKIRTP